MNIYTYNSFESVVNDPQKGVCVCVCVCVWLCAKVLTGQYYWEEEKKEEEDPHLLNYSSDN